jgi:integrase
VVKKLAERAGLDAVKYAGHSLRVGHATSAAIAGASERSIMRQTGHRSVQMVRRYIRDGSLFRENSRGEAGIVGPQRQAPAAIRWIQISGQRGPCAAG